VFKAAEHRVLPSIGERSRYSAPFFFNPDYDALVEPLDCALLLSLPTSSQPLSSIKHISENHSNTTPNEAEMTSEGLHQLHNASSSLNGRKYSSIRWGDYRTKRFLGDVRDEGDEIQIEQFKR